MTRTAPRRIAALGAAALAALAVSAAPALARGGDDGGGDDRPERRGEVEVAGTCGAGARSELKLSWEDGGLEAEFEVDQDRRGVVWRVVVVHERRVAWQGRRRTAGPSGSFEVRRVLPAWEGANTVSVRAWGPRGLTCRATATLA